MAGITIPHNWTPRWYQQNLWEYLTGAPFGAGGVDPRASDRKHAEVIWHRRAGKDDVCLHFAAREMFLNPANYWHMLPQANQVRKAIWEAVNPHTGRRRIDEAFPEEVFEQRQSDMMVRCRANSATWQCLGSDNFQGAIGSTPRGIVYSEWALANPSARGYLRPILLENKGWQLFITTPRGRNHAYSTYRGARENPDQFAELLTVYDTQALSHGDLVRELKEYINTYGESMGIALFDQEYLCSFDAAILGAIYGEEMRFIRGNDRVTTVPHDDRYPVHIGMDIGRTDDFSAWFFQVIGNEIRFIDHFSGAGKDPDEVCSLILGRKVAINLIRRGDNTEIVVELGVDIPGLEGRRAYRIGHIGIPHDGQAKTFVAKGKSVEEQFASVFGWSKITRVPRLSVQDGIQATRKALRRAVFDRKCENGLESLENYHREWDDDKKMFKDTPAHDFSSHDSDSIRYCSVMWEFEPSLRVDEEVRTGRSFNEMLELNRMRRLASD